MPETARAVVYCGPENFETQDFSLPELGAGDLLVEVLLCGVDGSELHMYRGEFAWLNEVAPVIFGDEILGRVVATGPAAEVSREIAVGDRVVIESRWPCEEGCRTCDRGQYYLCERRGGVFVGYGTMPSAESPHLWGGYATHVYVPAKALVYRVPDALPDTTALIACSPLANGMRWSAKGGVAPGVRVAVVGPGTQGLACALASVRAGAEVTLIGLEADRERLGLAGSFGVQTTFEIPRGETASETEERLRAAGDLFDVVIETAGAGTSKELAVRIVRALGTIVNVSVPTPAEQPIDWMALLQKEVTVVNPMSHPHTVLDAFALAEQLLDDDIDVGSWITHQYPLEEAETAIAAASYQLEERPVKVVLVPTKR